MCIKWLWNLETPTHFRITHSKSRPNQGTRVEMEQKELPELDIAGFHHVPSSELARNHRACQKTKWNSGEDKNNKEDVTRMLWNSKNHEAKTRKRKNELTHGLSTLELRRGLPELRRTRRIQKKEGEGRTKWKKKKIVGKGITVMRMKDEVAEVTAVRRREEEKRRSRRRMEKGKIGCDEEKWWGRRRESILLIRKEERRVWLGRNKGGFW